MSIYTTDSTSFLNQPRRTSLISSGPELRKSQPVYTGVLKYFPDALKYVSQVSNAGNKQHHPDKPLHWDKNKSTDNEDALTRHLIDHSVNPVDDDGLLHLGKVAWRALASLQIYLENDRKNIKGEVKG